MIANSNIISLDKTKGAFLLFNSLWLYWLSYLEFPSVNNNNDNNINFRLSFHFKFSTFFIPLPIFPKTCESTGHTIIINIKFDYSICFQFGKSVIRRFPIHLRIHTCRPFLRTFSDSGCLKTCKLEKACQILPQMHSYLR